MGSIVQRYYVVNVSGHGSWSEHRLLRAAKKSAQKLANEHGRRIEVHDRTIDRPGGVWSAEPRAPKKRRKRSSGGFLGGIFG